LTLALSLAGTIGVRCVTSGPEIVSPADGAPVTTPSFEVRVELPADAFDVATLTATLNGEPLTLLGGPTVFTASVAPGSPLAAQNELAVSVRPPLSIVTFHATRGFAYTPPRAFARRISSAGDLIHGPLAHSRIGDWLLENDVARFIVQDAPQRDLYAVGQYGGNLIDAELRSHPGADNFMEIQPGVSIETALNAQTVEIVNDGANGLPAVIRSCGPDDTLDFFNISSNVRDFGFQLPENQDDTDYPVEGCTEYELAAGDAHIRMQTTVSNLSDEELSLFVGEFINASGEVDAWMGGAGGIGDILTGTFDQLSFIGYGQATGVDYQIVPIAIPDSTFPRSDFVTTSGTTVMLHTFSILGALLGLPPSFTVPAHGENSFTVLFGVGDGSGGNALELNLATKGIATGTIRGCVTAGGVPAPRARIALGPRSGNLLTGLTTQYVTDATGCYEGQLKPGSYGVAAGRTGTPYQGAGSSPFANPVTIVAGGVVVQDIALPATGHLAISVTDEDGAAVPARVSVVGFDPSPDPLLFVPGVAGTPSANTSYFSDATNDPFPFGLARVAYAGADGHVDFDLEPGSYQVFVSRGTEWSLYGSAVTVAAGAPTQVAAQIARVLDTTGFVSGDYHVHGIASADSRVAQSDRVTQFAGEGVDNIIMTDHHAHTDLNPMIGSLNLTPFVHASVGEEITCWDCGHFNGYPFLVDPSRVSGGSTDWARAAPPGQDFKQYGAFILTPAELDALATTGSTATPDTVVQVNHIDSHFLPLEIDTHEVPPQSHISPEGKLDLRLDPASGNLFHHFKALELWNGANRSAQRQFLVERIGIWMNLLNQGLFTTAIADTDTHEYTNLNTAGACTWTPAASDAPAAVSDPEIGMAVKAGRAVGGQGLYVQARLLATDGSGAQADFTRTGSTLVQSSNGGVALEIRAQAPVWAPYDTIEIYANAPTLATGSRNGTPVLYQGTPERVLHAGTDFTVDTVNVAAGVAGAQRRETTLTVPYPGLVQDTWFVVVVKGTDGVSRPMFPVFPKDLRTSGNTSLAQLLDGNLGENGVLALGFTNALYADVDGTLGFQPPRTPAPAP
jgi:hypothetical protein